MIVGLGFTATMILIMRSQQIFGTAPLFTEFLGINAQGIGTLGMLLNFAVMIVVSLTTPPPPRHVQDLVENVRYPRALTRAELDESPVR
jgi:cation/acetate symporter